jgi:uncharacterized integral membrane protein
MSKQRKDTLVWGIILIFIGLIFILDNADIDVWEYIGKLWPLILIFWGCVKFIRGLGEKKEEAKPLDSDRAIE